MQRDYKLFLYLWKFISSIKTFVSPLLFVQNTRLAFYWRRQICLSSNFLIFLPCVVLIFWVVLIFFAKISVLATRKWNKTLVQCGLFSLTTHCFLIFCAQESKFYITRPNCALDRSIILCLYVPGFQRQVFKHVKILSERSKESKEQKKNKGSVLVAESAYNAQNAQLGFVMYQFEPKFGFKIVTPKKTISAFPGWPKMLVIQFPYMEKC